LSASAICELIRIVLFRGLFMTEIMNKGLKKIGVTVSKPVLALITILFGILVIVFPDFLPILVGVYFLIQGILMLLDYYELRR
jgi:uncharacterized membrane protein HdeD (DUF308 family)